jgi:hypothetical protein
VRKFDETAKRQHDSLIMAKKIAALKKAFDQRWIDLGNWAANLEAEDPEVAHWRGWRSKFEDLLIDTSWAVFEEARKSVEPDPPAHTLRTVREWCLQDEEKVWRILGHVECAWSWTALLEDLKGAVAAEVPLSDMIYRPKSTCCLQDLANLPPKSSRVEIAFKEMHGPLQHALKGVLAEYKEADLEEVVDAFPVLRGLTAEELLSVRKRRHKKMSARNMSLNLLIAPRCPTLKKATRDKYFRPAKVNPNRTRAVPL